MIGWHKLARVRPAGPAGTPPSAASPRRAARCTGRPDPTLIQRTPCPVSRPVPLPRRRRRAVTPDERSEPAGRRTLRRSAAPGAAPPRPGARPRAQPPAALQRPRGDCDCRRGRARQLLERCRRRPLRLDRRRDDRPPPRRALSRTDARRHLRHPPERPRRPRIRRRVGGFPQGRQPRLDRHAHPRRHRLAESPHRHRRNRARRDRAASAPNTSATRSKRA